ncbi:hypothetical protein [Denitromonas halophila]|uniref:DUF2752 domain-containing protein n=1 Tax=Denitromonas halophila TaxID=1629404 RepID=A0A557QXE7_9RHOO|nr:hypothetical protein [Denitromonas halophila]TVO57559.1 hypothetical protein FHP91_07735 [Denitromonas halophila]
MSGLPLVSCPACNAQMSLDALLGHQGARDAILALAYLHPGEKLVGAAVRYLALFAPAKQTMRFDRIASLLNELGEAVRAGRIEHKGISAAAPVDYWINAMEDMLANRDRLRLPLTSHGYLKSIVAGMTDRASAKAEGRAEAARAGHTAKGLPPPQPPSAAPRVSQPKSEMPEDIKAFMASFRKPKPTQEKSQ